MRNKINVNHGPPFISLFQSITRGREGKRKMPRKNNEMREGGRPDEDNFEDNVIKKKVQNQIKRNKDESKKQKIKTGWMSRTWGRHHNEQIKGTSEGKT